MKVSLARYGKPSSTATLQASPLLGETDGAWLITTYLEKGPKKRPASIFITECLDEVLNQQLFILFGVEKMP